jgi:hypothetical protein
MNCFVGTSHDTKYPADGGKSSSLWIFGRWRGDRALGDCDDALPDVVLRFDDMSPADFFPMRFATARRTKTSK